MADFKQLTTGEFEKFSELIYAHVGISMKPEKKELLNARLGKRLRICHIASFGDYYEFINRPEQKKLEFVNFLDSVSTNFTSFFREISHFEYLKKSVLPDLLRRNSGNGRESSFWSSASSSGEEPYTLAMVLNDFKELNPKFRYKITATDISTKVLALANRGVYAIEQTSKTPPEYLKKYFQKGVGNSAGKVKVRDNVRRQVAFQRFNLMHDFPWHNEIDVIFCRNVMIYFDRETQQRLVEKFYNSLAKGGYLFIGHSESISSLKHSFLQVEATTYKKE
jgi:chemotaxis protein methyltransferase CheR